MSFFSKLGQSELSPIDLTGDSPVTKPSGDVFRAAAKSARTQPTPYRNWCFTLYPHTMCEAASATFIDELAAQCDWLVIGKEVTPTTNIDHYQGFFLLRERKRNTWLYSMVKKATGGTQPVHFEPMGGTPDDNYKYCTKEYALHNPTGFKSASGKEYPPGIRTDDVFERGSRPEHAGGPGLREQNRFKAVRDILAKTADVDKIEDDQIYVTHFPSLQKIAAHHAGALSVPDLAEPRGVWIFGVPKSGKSRYARSLYDRASLYLKDCNEWWGGFHPMKHKAALIEDVDPTSIKHVGARLCKEWTDKYSFAANIKNSNAVLCPELVIFTSNYAIEDCFDLDDQRPMFRRCEIIYFPDEYHPDTNPNPRMFKYERDMCPSKDRMFKEAFPVEYKNGAFVTPIRAFPNFNPPPMKGVPVQSPSVDWAQREELDREYAAMQKAIREQAHSPVPVRDDTPPPPALKRSGTFYIPDTQPDSAVSDGETDDAADARHARLLADDRNLHQDLAERTDRRDAANALRKKMNMSD
nr:MAG: replication associated protein [Cressdnaviricota sp.]